MALIKWLLQSADHSEGGASQKKLIGFFFVALVAWLDYAYIEYRLKAHNEWGEFISILVIHLSFLSVVIGVNWVFETFLRKNDNNKPQ